MSRIEDQELAGLIMWMPAGVSYVAAGLWLIAHSLKEVRARPAASAA